MSDKPIKGILNSRVADSGATEYKVRFAGCDKSEDAWGPEDAVAAAQVANFLKRKAKKKQGPPAASLQPVKTIDKKKKGTLAETTGQQASGGPDGGEEDSDDGDDGNDDGASEAKRLEMEDDGIPVAADEVDPADIIPGKRRRRKAAAAAELSADWKGLASKIGALGDDSDSD